MANEGANLLGQVLQKHTKKLTKKPPILDFGTILSDMSLKTDNFPVSIPQNDYMVCRSVAWNKFAIFTSTYYDGSHPHGNSGEHPHGSSGKHPHGDSGDHEHILSGGDHKHVTPEDDTIAGGEHEHQLHGGTHEHPESEGAHEHPSTEGKHVHPETEGYHAHNVLFPGMLKPIKPGDRVLVAWVGDTCTVIDIILPAKIISTYKEPTED
jgi:hypothetical protein